MHSAGGSPEVFRSRFNRIIAVCAWVLDAALLGGTVATDALAAHPALVVPAGLIAVASWVTLWHPGVTVDDEKVSLVNIVRTVSVPWEALIDVDTQYALTLRTPRRSYSAWAAPAPGRAGAAIARRTERRHGAPAVMPGTGGRSRPGDMLGTESGDAAYLVRSRWQSLIAEGRVEAGLADETAITVRWHLFSLVALTALAVGSAFALGWA